MLNPGRMLEHIPGLPDLILFWMNDVSVIRVSKCGITRGTHSDKHVLTLIWMMMTGGSFKIVSNWAVLTPEVPPTPGRRPGVASTLDRGDGVGKRSSAAHAGKDTEVTAIRWGVWRALVGR